MPIKWWVIYLMSLVYFFTGMGLILSGTIAINSWLSVAMALASLSLTMVSAVIWFNR